MFAQESKQAVVSANLGRIVRASLVGIALAAAGASPALAMNVKSNINVPGTLELEVTGGCNNRGGPYIELGPTITLHNVPVTVEFDGGGDHDERVTSNVNLVLTLANGPIKLPKQGAAPDGVTGNPKISVYVNGTQVLGPVRCNRL